MLIWDQNFKSIDSLLACPAAFMKINSTLPSSAAIERLFSAAAHGSNCASLPYVG